jgi:predicted amidophosphoribosyltransferase
MMKCKYCGGNLTLEQAYCPHCGRPNEEAAQHVKDMEHYKSNFEDTKSDVYEVTENLGALQDAESWAKTARIIVAKKP